MRMLEPEAVRHSNDELAHCPGRHELVAALRLAKPGQIDGYQVGMRRESRPSRLEGVETLRPGTQEESIITCPLALREPDGESVDGADLRLDRLVQRDRHNGLALRFLRFSQPA